MNDNLIKEGRRWGKSDLNWRFLTPCIIGTTISLLIFFTIFEVKVHAKQKPSEPNEYIINRIQKENEKVLKEIDKRINELTERLDEDSENLKDLLNELKKEMKENK